MKQFLKDNWFKIVIIILFVWFIWTLGHLNIHHTGWIENENPTPQKPKILK